MRYSIVFSDIDGTLVPFGQNHPSEATVEALHRLKDKGVKLVVATGRGPAHITANFLGGVIPDYYIAFNGAYIMDGAGNKLFDSPMNEEQFEAIEKMGRAGHAVGYSFDDGYYVYHNADKLVTLSGATPKKGRGLQFNLRTDRHLESMPYVSFCNYPDEEVERFNRENPSLKLVYHRPGAYDLCQSAHNKATAAALLLEHLGLAPENALAIGDAGNDLELLQAVGFGIAMGNALDFLKQAADYVTDTAENDGAAKALRQFIP